MATPKWLKNLGKQLQKNVLPVAASLLGGTAIGGLIGRIAGGGKTREQAEAAVAAQAETAAPAAPAAPAQMGVGGFLSAKVAGVPVVAVLAALAVAGMVFMRRKG